MMKMTNKVLASSLVILAALGLAGCTNSAAAPTKTSTSATKVSQQISKKAASSTSSEGTKNQSFTSTRAQSTSSMSADSKVAVSNSHQKLTSQATKVPNSPVTNSQSATTNANSSTQNDQQVLTSFVKTSGVQEDGNHYYMTKNNQNNNYQIEVRNNQGGDPNIAHLTGTYQYDPATNQIHEMNPITGNYNN
ncbi:hypothetical protein H5R92_02295 [Limosilactobacillus sp. BG-MG3-A]|uniref:Lipoprotein n=1 Tax=Limosilactobacillus agrestis TaxID=2759748 RepID=A0A7W3UGL2_9LACO|nr:hypothetical protein [Limosilactobacillus agrestis]MBD5091239.1 hypothetical protein [Lactobacillus sp.]MBB1095049.1 hypothetical protein [Limosilactobacillus agrestis]MBB1099063.1 hypothetical protein [Limosilactobacillus agrestis]MCD7112529.1 hypothetical protein [Limosilactobacillus agrestis]MCD7119365.1 hypothetical protein [Limosilactobacillus agrestis]